MIKIDIHTQTGILYNGEVSYVTFPGEFGRFSVYPLHAPIISTLKKGDIICFSPDEEETRFSIQNGFVEVKNDRAIVCVELLYEQNKNKSHG